METLAKKNSELLRLQGLSESLRKVVLSVSKFPFREENYTKMVQEFGSRKTIKKVKLLEEVQRALFVAQISDDKDSLRWIEKLLV